MDLPLTFGFLSGPFYAPLDRLQFQETFLLLHIGRNHDVGIASPNRNYLHLPPILHRIFPWLIFRFWTSRFELSLIRIGKINCRIVCFCCGYIWSLFKNQSEPKIKNKKKINITINRIKPSRYSHSSEYFVIIIIRPSTNIKLLTIYKILTSYLNVD